MFFGSHVNVKTTQRPIRVQLPPAVLKIQKTALARAAKDIPIAKPAVAQPSEVRTEESESKKGSHPSGKKGRTLQKKIKETVAPAIPAHRTSCFKAEIQRVFQTQFCCCFSQKILSENKRLGNFLA